VAKKRSVASRPRTRSTPVEVPTPAEPAPELRSIPLEAIQEPARPVRRALGDLAALAETMRDYGLQQPISLRAVSENRYLLTSGLRRLHAARMLGWGHILAFVRTVSADQAYLLDLIENLQREDLSAAEEADAFSELIRTRGWTGQQVADAVKRSIAYVSKRVRIFEDLQLRDAIVRRGLPVSTAEEMLAAEPEVRIRLIDRALEEGWDQGHARVALQAFERTRVVREFHRIIMQIQAEDLSTADRAALRALFRDLVLIARASTTPAPRIFPPLPGRQ
jgi:ParB/RepB/Spo0J family partition protein